MEGTNIFLKNLIVWSGYTRIVAGLTRNVGLRKALAWSTNTSEMLKYNSVYLKH